MNNVELKPLDANQVNACISGFAMIMQRAYNPPIADRWISLADDYFLQTRFNKDVFYNYWQVQRGFMNYAEPILTAEFFPQR
jgi:hypothetical protein